jgi:hypothetical protein
MMCGFPPDQGRAPEPRAERLRTSLPGEDQRILSSSRLHGALPAMQKLKSSHELLQGLPLLGLGIDV